MLMDERKRRGARHRIWLTNGLIGKCTAYCAATVGLVEQQRGREIASDGYDVKQ